MTNPPIVRNLFEPNPDFVEWIPPEELLNILKDDELRAYEKVELVCGYYAWQHHGQHPFASEIAKVLNVSKQAVEHSMDRLRLKGRATKKNGKFALVNGRYTNPTVAKLLQLLNEEL